MFLKIFYGIDRINPIEIPPVLKTEEFLKRKYSILKKDNLPTKGKYFIKNASTLKDFTYLGDISKFNFNIDNNTMLVCSEIVKPLSEYRVYFCNGNIYSIANYDGDPTIFPDVNLIKKANLIYSLQEDYPKSYVMDVMITEKGTSIVEIHIAFSCGIYFNPISRSFLYSYFDALQYTKKFNSPIK